MDTHMMALRKGRHRFVWMFESTVKNAVTIERQMRRFVADASLNFDERDYVEVLSRLLKIVSAKP